MIMGKASQSCTIGEALSLLIQQIDLGRRWSMVNALRNRGQPLRFFFFFSTED